MYVVVVQKFTFAISSPDEFLYDEVYAYAAHVSKSLYCFALSPKLPHPVGDLDPHLTLATLGSSESTTQMASRLVQPFLQAY